MDTYTALPDRSALALGNACATRRAAPPPSILQAALLCAVVPAVPANVSQVFDTSSHPNQPDNYGWTVAEYRRLIRWSLLLARFNFANARRLNLPHDDFKPLALHRIVELDPITFSICAVYVLVEYTNDTVKYSMVYL